jgi:hypothetical protein
MRGFCSRDNGIDRPVRDLGGRGFGRHDRLRHSGSSLCSRESLLFYTILSSVQILTRLGFPRTITVALKSLKVGAAVGCAHQQPADG